MPFTIEANIHVASNGRSRTNGSRTNTLSPPNRQFTACTNSVFVIIPNLAAPKP